MILIYTPRSHAGPRLSYITPAPASSHRRRAVLRLAHRRRDARRSQQRANPPLQAGACRNSRRARRWRLCCGTCPNAAQSPGVKARGGAAPSRPVRAAHRLGRPTLDCGTAGEHRHDAPPSRPRRSPPARTSRGPAPSAWPAVSLHAHHFRARANVLAEPVRRAVLAEVEVGNRRKHACRSPPPPHSLSSLGPCSATSVFENARPYYNII